MGGDCDPQRDCQGIRDEDRHPEADSERQRRQHQEAAGDAADKGRGEGGGGSSPSEMQMVAQKQIEDLRLEISRREQEILQMSTKMKTLEEQHQDYQKHIAVLKESLCAKEEHYTMLQTDVD